MATKAYFKFVQRVDSYDADLELLDVIVRRFMATPSSDASIAVALGSTNDRHVILGRHSNTAQARKVCGLHLKHTLYAAYIKDLFEDFSGFLAETMTKAALKGIDAKRFVGDVKLDVSTTDLLACGNWDAAVRLISDSIFRKLENERSTSELLKKANARLGLNLRQATVDAAMPYLDARHILVHQDGVTDQTYREAYPRITLKGHKILLDFGFISDAKRCIGALALEIENAIIAARLVRTQDMHGRK